MRLKKIKLAGFKSFVDPTTVDFHSDRVAIVGPNGCGKSNVIDAVRWVMGESSAKQLRGESMADVIFSGSSGRAPVGQASVELVFDNSDGSLGGEYAAFSEIAIKRLVTRDGTSNYYLNGARCRRKDITDIFLGTGLGPRSYAIIEQGMISRLIESKPEDLRVFLEEAAGISKYKERRRETETRIRHTRENLERLTDLRDELAKQLLRLEKQAEAAEKYKQLKTALRQVEAEHFALKWRGLDTEMLAAQRELAEQENGVEKEVANLRHIDAQIETQRVDYDAAQEHLQKIQSEYYRTCAQVAKHEQALEHQRERIAQLDMDIAEVIESFEELQASCGDDEAQHQLLQTQLNTLTPQVDHFEAQYKTSYHALNVAEEAMHAWQKQWETLTAQLAHSSEQATVAQTKITHLQESIQTATQRTEVLKNSYTALGGTDLTQTIQGVEAQCQESTAQLAQTKEAVAELQQQLRTQQADNETTQHQLDKTREELQGLQREYVSLQALQQAAFDQQQDAAKNWLQDQHLADKQRLVQQLVVEPEWVCAVETVLGSYLQAICVDEMAAFTDKLVDFSQGSLVLFEKNTARTQSSSPTQTTLLSKIQTSLSVGSLLDGVYCAQSLAEALSLRKTLSAHESVVTKEGVWLSAEWLRVTRSVDQQAGILGREQRLQTLQPQVATLNATLQDLQHTILAGKDKVKWLGEEYTQAQHLFNQQARIDADLQAQQRALVVKQQDIQTQKEKISQEMGELEQSIAQRQQHLASAEAIQQEASFKCEQLTVEKADVEARRNELAYDLQQAKMNAQNDQAQSNQLRLQLSGVTHKLEAIAHHLQRTEQQLAKLHTRREQLEEAREQANGPLHDIGEQLEQTLEQQVQDDALLQTARGQIDAITHALRNNEQQRLQCEERVQVLRSALEEYRLNLQTLRVKRDSIAEQLQALEMTLETLLESLPQDAQVLAWAEKEEKLNAQIKRLGAINLAAIDEYAEHAQRLEYLNAQDADLLAALDTLQQAIEKIDKETKHRFKETFDAVNQGLTTLFSQVFGGGSAYLELTDSDLLNTGVSIMAQPPGKRNSSIHALSGGEKALTALSLVFSLFRLNPAPFCMLDEVDAPLDDANVTRFARMVKEMSAHIQFIFITHNKGTMEIADHLMGVTMKEAGVSRIVSVDVDKAAQLAVA